MSSLQFARILDPVCSCGNYVGKLQHQIEFALVEREKSLGRKSDDTDVAEIITDMGIKRICCRRTIIISPVLRLMKTEPEFTVYLDKETITENMNRLNVGNNSPNI